MQDSPPLRRGGAGGLSSGRECQGLGFHSFNKFAYGRKNQKRLIENLFIRESDRAISMLIKNRIAFLVVFSVLLMDLTVNLNDQPCFGAIEINNKSIDDVLPSELDAAQLFVV